jgi:hypothetical protein
MVPGQNPSQTSYPAPTLLQASSPWKVVWDTLGMSAQKLTFIVHAFLFVRQGHCKLCSNCKQRSWLLKPTP